MWKLIFLCLCVSMTLKAEINVLAFAGSTRKDSVNKKLVKEAAVIAKDLGANVTLIDLKDFDMPFFDGDLETNQGMPAKAKELQDLFLRSQVIILSAPEYNGSLSGVLKNAIDWITRKLGGGSSREAFVGKKFVLLSASPGTMGGARGLGHLRTIIQNIGGNVVQGQVTVPDAYNAFDNEGHLKNEKVKEELRQLIKTALEPV